MADIQGLRASFSGRELRRHLQTKIRDLEDEIRKIEAREPRPNESMTPSGVPRVDYSAVKQSGSPFAGGITPIGGGGGRNGNGTAVVSVKIDRGRIREYHDQIEFYQFWLDHIEDEHTYHLDEYEMATVRISTPSTRRIARVVPEVSRRGEPGPRAFNYADGAVPGIGGFFSTEEPVTSSFETIQVPKPNFYENMLLGDPDIAAIVLLMALTPENTWRWNELPEHRRPAQAMIDLANGYLRAGNHHEAVEILFPYLPQQRVDAIASELAKLETIAREANPSAFEVKVEPEGDV